VFITTTGYTYLYDQLNRLLNTRQHVFGTASGSYKGNWSQSNTGTTDNYAETFRYDANGNILQLNRNGNSQHPGGLAMDRLNYTYRDGTNQLWSVQDGIASGAYAGDIDNQGGSNYSYDRIGNLIGDVSENISQVNWTVYGKIGNIQKKQAFLGYVYNAGGERVVKQYLPYATNQCAECPPGTGIDDLEVYERNTATPETYKASKTITFLSEYTDVRYRDYSAIIEAGLAQCTPQCAARPPLASSDADIYIRDATGNVLAVYHYDRKTSQLRWSEQHLYGSARLGMYLPEKLVTSVSTDSKQREVGYLGKQVFELSNHLGNVLATITDKKLQVSLNTTSTAYFEADVQTVQDYYAFGMQMPGRKLSGGYRYGFNGKENDNEVKGEGNQQDYGFRFYDPRVGRFLSLDPLQKNYPFYTPYQFGGNSPIANLDLDGREDIWFMSWLIEMFVEVKLKGSNAGDNFSRTVKQTNAAANNNYGKFDETGKNGSVQDQVDANNLNVYKGKIQMTAQVAKGGAVGMAFATTPFIAAAAVTALPELFVAAGSKGAGSYLIQKTVSAALDATAQKTITGKIDWADVASNFLPVKSKLGKALLTSFQASTDYTSEDGWQSVFASSDKNKKSMSDALVDAFTSAAVDKIFGNFNKQLEKAFREKGLKGDKLTQAVGKVVSAQSEYLQGALKVAASEGLKDKINDKPKK
jgi:RHS repeat-associated protein